MDWLYRTSTTQTTTTNPEGQTFTHEVVETQLLGGALVYQVSKRAAPSPSTLPTVPTSPTLPGPLATKPQTLARKLAHEGHWLDVDRTADSRAESPDIPEPGENPGQNHKSSAEDGKGEKEDEEKQTITRVGVLGFNVYGTAGRKPQTSDQPKRHESHWLDVDRIADSRNDSPAQSPPGTPTPASPTAKRQMVGSPLAQTS